MYYAKCANTMLELEEISYSSFLEELVYLSAQSKNSEIRADITMLAESLPRDKREYVIHPVLSNRYLRVIRYLSGKGFLHPNKTTRSFQEILPELISLLNTSAQDEVDICLSI